MRIIKYVSGIIVVGFLVFNAYSNFAQKRANAFNDEGLTYLNMTKYDEAVAMFGKAIEVNGISKDFKITVLRNLAVAHEQNGDVEKAIDFYLKAAEKSNANSYMHDICMADIAMLESDIESAINHLHSALKTNKRDFVVHNNLGLIYLGTYDEAYTDFEKALEYNKTAFKMCGDLNTQFVLGKNYFGLNDFKNAEIHLQNVVTNVPDEPEFHYYFGLTEYYLDKKQEARNHLNIAVDSNPVYLTDEVNAIINN